MSRTMQFIAVIGLTLALLLLAPSRASSQVVVTYGPPAPLVYPGGVRVAYYAPPVVPVYAPRVSVAYYAPPAVSYYAPAPVAYYPAPVIGYTRYGYFGRPRVTTFYYGPGYYWP